MVKDIKEQGVIQESNSPWNSPIFLVPKKDGTFRPVIDFRRVNEVTVDDHYPLPVLRDLLMCLGTGYKVFSSLDLLCGNWQLPKAPEPREITAFSTPSGHFEWIRMPFGLKGAPLTFQRTMNIIFGDMLGNSVYIYLDDIIIASKDMSSHMDTLQEVIKRLLEIGLKFKITKCEFLKPRIKFLGHEVDEEGIHTGDDKITAVANFPQKKTVENIRSFLGLAGYYRPFIKSFAALASPLTKLLKKSEPFHWVSEQDNNFKDLKHALTYAPLRTFPNFKDPFLIYTDASTIDIGAVFMQTDGAGKNHVIAFACRVLTPAEKNYSVINLEILAVVWALKHFRDIIMGYKTTVYSDHSPITEIFKGRNLSGRLARWYLTIQTYNPEIRYTKLSSNVVADSLSRNIHVGAVTFTSPMTTFNLDDLSNAQREHHIWKKVIYALESGDETKLPDLPIPFSHFFLSQDNVLCRYWPQKPVPVEQLVMPEKLVSQVLSLINDIPLGVAHEAP